MREFDLIIVGSGSGNSILTEEYQDLNVAIVEPGTFGGTCLNVGCIPTKMYVYPATVAREAEDASRLGVRASVDSVDWQAMRDRIFTRIDAIANGGLTYRQSLENVSVIQEYVHFVEPKVLETESGERITAPHIVLANGSRVQLPEIPGIDLPGVHTSDTVMRLDELPESIIVVGGGYIAAEFCHVFNGLGSKVTQLNRSERLLRHHDDTIGKLTVSAAASDESQQSWEGTADVVLMATGRVPNADTLNPEAAHLDVSDSGLLAVDDYQRVLSNGQPVEGLWALGTRAPDCCWART